MKVLLDIKDEKAQALLEILKGLSFVKTKTLTSSKAKFIEDVKEAVEEMKLVKAGKLKPKSAQEFLDEL
ncbi:hypothetical protein [Leptospira santarosai]|uniref:Toxin-antitoxin system, antitoxin component, ribbon-helix-helix domain protein n=1 Tax=Leptospira santarosai TaxID=28183 RepID=A0AB73LKI0_9LEPT|nr:hypothetical protein [Leptospira santarosai]AVV51284.1 Uncharacterized protein XB17_02705 [Leptospira santarosai]AVV78354.1 Uncharacterized protein XB15_00557 [Leptospira santarosai]MDI7219543.1 hypothetical protein [Leptospira santarosai]MDI7226565.1 hypothetical protein [Leptospira santarosai]ONF83205.1 hypothetical protein BWD13_19310 [Leptospira santarosai serovar Grippotyphosa]